MQYTILLLLACQVIGQDEGDVDGGFAGSPEFDGHGPSQPAVSLLTHHQQLDDDGTFKYSFSADNGLQQREAFHPDGSRTGAYSYVDPRGETVLVHYRADRFGFHILDGSSIPTTPPLAGRPQGHLSNYEDGEGPRGHERSSYEVDELEGEGSSSDTPPSPTPAPGPFGFEMSRAPNMPGLHNRFYRSAARELFSKAIIADQDNLAAEDLSGAASSYYGLPGYAPVDRKRSPYKSPYASLARQIKYPLKKGRAETQYARPNDEQASATDAGDYGRHAGLYDDGSYAQHAHKYDDGSYQQHAIKYDDGSYDKYADVYGEGQYDEPSSHYADDVGRGEYEAAFVRQPGESYASHY